MPEPDLGSSLGPQAGPLERAKESVERLQSRSSEKQTSLPYQRGHQLHLWWTHQLTQSRLCASALGLEVSDAPALSLQCCLRLPQLGRGHAELSAVHLEKEAPPVPPKELCQLSRLAQEPEGGTSPLPGFSGRHGLAERPC